MTQQLNPFMNWDNSEMSLDDLAANIATATQNDCMIEIDGPLVWIRLRNPLTNVISSFSLIPDGYGSKTKKLTGNPPAGITTWDLEDAVNAVLS